MDEFVSRMATQRQVLDIVNSRLELDEKLLGLSSSAIDRWAVSNQLGPSSEVVKLLKNISSQLFFMATRSQEPVSSEYELRKEKIIEAVTVLENTV
ncbi:hypothetical protein [Halomonas ramblicola]|uniref:hypothetical protein n=1 Tax=Halomonas ramblicola TaxID=747349 RepID=UPI0025B4BBCA|nr:hypothetical protein [Halomonas ramblicola]MDN3521152.1 hypothetical protein [Halomonas ramblicola]